jgi:hypothetical protein
MTWFQNDRPTRAVDVAAPMADVLAMCARKKAAISASEALPCGGTHVVLVTLDQADTVRDAFKNKLLPRGTPRFSWRTRAYGY